jgi:hypothetical protein
MPCFALLPVPTTLSTLHPFKCVQNKNVTTTKAKAKAKAKGANVVRENNDDIR